VFGIVTTLRAGRSANLVPVREIVSSFLQINGRLLFPKQPTAEGVQESLPEARRPGLEFNVSFLPCCEIKNEWSYTSPPESPQYTIWPDVTEVLHLVITILGTKFY